MANIIRLRSARLRSAGLAAVAPAVVLAAALAGCATFDEPMPGSSCAGAGSSTATGIDWAAAQPVTVAIRDQDFAPIAFALVRDRAYVLTINNADTGSRTLRAPDFFATVLVESASVGGAAVADLCLTGLTVPPQGSAEVRFVALRDGRYDVTDGWFKTAFEGYESGRGIGVIYVN